MTMLQRLRPGSSCQHATAPSRRPTHRFAGACHGKVNRILFRAVPYPGIKPLGVANALLALAIGSASRAELIGALGACAAGADAIPCQHAQSTMHTLTVVHTRLLREQPTHAQLICIDIWRMASPNSLAHGRPSSTYAYPARTPCTARLAPCQGSWKSAHTCPMPCSACRLQNTESMRLWHRMLHTQHRRCAGSTGRTPLCCLGKWERRR